MPLLLQIRRISFEIGMGFNGEYGLAIGTALKDFSIQENPAASGPGSNGIDRQGVTWSARNFHPRERSSHLGRRLFFNG